jgi:hypothetical protein
MTICFLGANKKKQGIGGQYIHTLPYRSHADSSSRTMQIRLSKRASYFWFRRCSADDIVYRSYWTSMGAELQHGVPIASPSFNRNLEHGLPSGIGCRKRCYTFATLACRYLLRSRGPGTHISSLITIPLCHQRLLQISVTQTSITVTSATTPSS